MKKTYPCLGEFDKVGNFFQKQKPLKLDPRVLEKSVTPFRIELQKNPDLKL